jgi:hypothetical protein
MPSRGASSGPLACSPSIFCAVVPVARRRDLTSARTARCPLLPLLAFLLATGSTPVASAAAPVVSLDPSFSGAEGARFLPAGSTRVGSTLAGGGARCVDGTGTAAPFNGAFGVGVDAARCLSVDDSLNNRIRTIAPPSGVTVSDAGGGT